MGSIDKDTKVCVSISLKPGNFGAIVHNAAYEATGLNYIYKPFGVKPEDLENAVNAIRVFNICGCGVSMPYKGDVIKYLDKLDEGAKKIGAVNTIVNDNGILTGYNTDYYGAKMALESMFNPEGKRVLIVGAGGAARAISLAAKDLGAKEIYIANRDNEKAALLAKEFGLIKSDFKEIQNLKAELLVNATPVGMSPDTEKAIIEAPSLKNFKALLDVITAPPETRLMKNAKKVGLVVIPGHLMSLHQAAKQFELYTEKAAPLEAMRESLKTLLGVK